MKSNKFKAHNEACSDFTIWAEAQKINNVIFGENHIKCSVIDNSKRKLTVDNNY